VTGLQGAQTFFLAALRHIASRHSAPAFAGPGPAQTTRNIMASLDSFKCRREMNVAGKSYVYFDLKQAEANGLAGVSKLPYTLKVLLENLLRFEDGRTVTKADIEALAAWVKTGKSSHEIQSSTAPRAC